MSNIMKGLELKGTPAFIPNCGRDDLPQFFVEMGYKVGAEIGVYKGEFTKKFLDVGLKMYGVDPWTPYEEFDRMTEIRRTRLDFLYEHTKRYLEPYLKTKQCELIKKTSMDALKDIPDESLDFVYIDGNHMFKYVAEDMCEWWKKIRKGGAMTGHDYTDTPALGRRWEVIQVKFVVDGFTLANHISNWYVLGTEKKRHHEIRDRWRSWLIIK
jgi:hypothetical protein